MCGMAFGQDVIPGVLGCSRLCNDCVYSCTTLVYNYMYCKRYSSHVTVQHACHRTTPLALDLRFIVGRISCILAWCVRGDGAVPASCAGRGPYSSVRIVPHSSLRGKALHELARAQEAREYAEEEHRYIGHIGGAAERPALGLVNGGGGADA